MRRAPRHEVLRIVVLGLQWYVEQIEHIPLGEVTWVHWRGQGRRSGGVVGRRRPPMPVAGLPLRDWQQDLWQVPVLVLLDFTPRRNQS